MNPRKTKISFRTKYEATFPKIVADAAIATVLLGEGRLIPLLIIDTSDRPDIEELVRVHEHVKTGDVEGQWAEVKGRKGKIYLILEFHRPTVLKIVLEFDIETQGGLVDLALTAGGLYVQPGREGDRFMTTPDHPRILVQVSETGFRSHWEHLFLKHLVGRFRRNGLSRPQAKRAARKFLTECRKLLSFRIRPSEPRD